MHDSATLDTVPVTIASPSEAEPLVRLLQRQAKVETGLPPMGQSGLYVRHFNTWKKADETGDEAARGAASTAVLDGYQAVRTYAERSAARSQASTTTAVPGLIPSTSTVAPRRAQPNAKPVAEDDELVALADVPDASGMLAKAERVVRLIQARVPAPQLAANPNSDFSVFVRFVDVLRYGERTVSVRDCVTAVNQLTHSWPRVFAGLRELTASAVTDTLSSAGTQATSSVLTASRERTTSELVRDHHAAQDELGKPEMCEPGASAPAVTSAEPASSAASNVKAPAKTIRPIAPTTPVGAPPFPPLQTGGTMGALAVITPETLALYAEQARDLLLKCTDLHDAKAFATRAEVVATYVRSLHAGLAAQSAAEEVVLRARRRLGELTRDLPKAPAGRKSNRSHAPTYSGKAASLMELGITKQEASTLEKLASIPRAPFDKYLADTKAAGRPPTTRGALALAPTAKKAPPRGHGVVPKAEHGAGPRPSGAPDDSATAPQQSGLDLMAALEQAAGDVRAALSALPAPAQAIREYREVSQMLTAIVDGTLRRTLECVYASAQKASAKPAKTRPKKPAVKKTVAQKTVPKKKPQKKSVTNKTRHK